MAWKAARQRHNQSSWQLKTPLPLPGMMRRSIIKSNAGKLKIKEAYQKIEQLIIEEQNAVAESNVSI